jgi:hypothetical protein
MVQFWVDGTDSPRGICGCRIDNSRAKDAVRADKEDFAFRMRLMGS